MDEPAHATLRTAPELRRPNRFRWRAELTCWLYLSTSGDALNIRRHSPKKSDDGPARTTYDLWRVKPFAKLKRCDVFTAYVQTI